MVVVLSLAKAFSASGAAMVFPDIETAKLVRTCGSTMIFSGPLQPALLGAGIASACIHLSEDIVVLQRQLEERIKLFNELVRAAELPLKSSVETPIRFIGIGTEVQTGDTTEQLMERGYFVNVAVYPAVPRGHAGIRIALTVHQTLDDVRNLVGELQTLCRGSRQPNIRGLRAAPPQR